ncbi:phage tail tape measure protein [Cellulosimicrobium cellulans]|uniref:phage tail tape measure protein n=1 Tax=Cellulosimicrobium cellulans TaxID=1710 RepID=UPI001966A121|nr:phage tail tape measure protein [Cellulosimicrobium cellulans]MBN0039483.1 phage tail tape measure protein [Cellulosimicrobium cellulans]
MADRSIVVRLRAEVADFKRSMKDASDSVQGAVKSTGDFVSKNEQHINTLSNGLGIVGLGMAGFATLAVAKFAEFDAAMSSVQAATMESTDSMALLREAAIQAGADTQYSATEAAGAIEELAKAGVSTSDILGGGLTGALNLAASGAIDVASAAEIAASAMTQFGLSGEDVTHIADLLAAGAGKAQGGVEDLGMALNQAGLVASQTGLSIEETVGGLTAFAAAGLTGSDAGTSFKTMLQSLTPSSREAAKLMEELGISAYDSQGNFIGLAEFAGVLKGSLSELSVEQQNAAMKTIFGADAVRAASVLFQEGESGVREWIAAVDDQGYAAEQAAIRMDNLKGDLEGLSGSFETLLIRLGEGADGPLRGLVQGLDSVVDALGGMSPAAQGALLSIVGGGGLVALGVAGLGKLAVGVNEARLALQGLNISAKTAGITVGVMGTALGVAGVALALWAQNAAEARARTEALKTTLDEFGETTEATTASLNDTLSQDQRNWLDKLLGRDPVTAIDLAKRMGLTVKDLTDYIVGQADAIDRVNDASTKYLDSGSFLEVDDRIADVNRLTKVLDDQAASLSLGQKEQLQKAEADKEAGIAAQGAAEAAAEHTAAVQADAEALRQWIEDTAAVHQSFIDLGGAYQGAIDANRAFAKSTAEATSSSEDSWEDFYDGQSVSAEEYITQLQNQVAAQEAWASNMTNLSSRVNSTMTGDMQTAANAMIDELLQLGPEGAAAVQLLNDMSDAELAEVVSLYQRKGASSGAQFAAEINKTRPNPIPVGVNMDPAYQGVDTFIAIASQKTLTIQARVAADPNFNPASSPYMIPRAEGGPIPLGLGTPGKDSVPVLAMPGEHMLTVEDVDNLGGHAGVFALRQAAKSGLRGFAQGGPVAPTPYMYQQAASPAPSALSSQRMDVSASAYFTDAQVAVLAAAFAQGAARSSSAAFSASARDLKGRRRV